MFLSYNEVEKDKNDSCDTIKEEAKKERKFTQVFHLNELNKLYPGKYEKYIYLKDKKNNKSIKKFFDIEIYCQ